MGEPSKGSAGFILQPGPQGFSLAFFREGSPDQSGRLP